MNTSVQSGKGQTTSGKEGMTRLVWANIYLDPAQKEAARLFSADDDKFFSCWHDLLACGYSLSTGYNDQTNSFICTLIGKNTGGVNDGVGMTTHAGTVLEAIQRALYKHYVVCENDSWVAVAESMRPPQP